MIKSLRGRLKLSHVQRRPVAALLLLVLVGCAEYIDDQTTSNDDQISASDNRISTPQESPTVNTSDSVSKSGTELHLRLVEIMDNEGFENPVVAIRFLAPAGWGIEGGIRWNYGFRCISELVQAQVRAVSPDGSMSFELFPNYFAEWVEDQMELQVKQQALQMGQRQCPLYPPFDASTFLTQILATGFRPGASVESTEPNPPLAKAMAERVRRQLPPGAAAHNFRTDAATAVISYGASEERIMATTYVTQMQGPSMTAQAQGGFYLRNQYFSAAEGVYAFRTPRGELAEQEALFATMVGSLQISPAWQTAVTLVRNEIAQNEIREIGKAARLWAQASREAQDIRNQSWQEGQNNRDQLATGWSQTMRGVASYLDPENNTTVELTDGFENVWAKNGNEFLLSTNPTFNPNIAFTEQSWNRLRRVSQP